MLDLIRDPLTIDNCGNLFARVRVFINGEDITNDCYGCSPREGWADCLQVVGRNPLRLKREGGDYARFRRTGKVQVKLRV